MTATISKKFVVFQSNMKNQFRSSSGAGLLKKNVLKPFLSLKPGHRTHLWGCWDNAISIRKMIDWRQFIALHVPGGWEEDNSKRIRSKFDHSGKISAVTCGAVRLLREHACRPAEPLRSLSFCIAKSKASLSVKNFHRISCMDNALMSILVTVTSGMIARKCYRTKWLSKL